MTNLYKPSTPYTDTEITLLQKHIAGLSNWDDTVWNNVSDSAEKEGYERHIIPFYPLLEIASTLFYKLQRDNQIKTYSIYSFFPQIYELVYGPKPPSISFQGRTRGQVALIQHDSLSVVIKPYQSGQEPYIADIAGKIGIGPRQLPTIQGFLTEAFLPDPFLTDIPNLSFTRHMISTVGANLGSLLFELHQEKIVYNDTTISDPTGRSHLVVTKDATCQLIDFGVSVRLDNLHSLEPEDIYNLARTTPMFRLFSGLGNGPTETIEFLTAYRRHLLRTSLKSIMDRDIKFAEQGISMLARRVGDWVIEPFLSSFRGSYC